MNSNLQLLPGGAQHGEWAALWEQDHWRQSELPNGDLSSGHRGDKIIGFSRITQSWLKESAKRFAKMRVLSGSSLGTVTAYVSDVARFGGWLEAHRPDVIAPTMVSREVVEDYLLFVRTENVKPATRSRWIGSLRLLLEEQRDDGLAGLPSSALIHGREIPKVPYALPKRSLTDHVFGQIISESNLALISERHRTIILLFALTGLRVSSVITLPRHPVSRGPDDHPYLRYRNVKMGRESLLPIPERLVEQLERNEQWLAEHQPESEHLLPAGKAGTASPHISASTVFRNIQSYVVKAQITGEDGELATWLHPHLFRHHIGTSLVNDGVPLNVIAKVLDHNSLQMTAHYAHIHDKTLREELERWHKRVNARGEHIALPTDGPLAEASWMKERIARAKQALPNGYCGLPLVQTCPHPNACLSCDNFLTDGSFLEMHRDHLARTESIIESATESGQVRLINTLETDRTALVQIIGGLEELESAEMIDLRDALEAG